MKNITVTAALLLGIANAHAASSEGPSIINIIAREECTLTIEPGHRDLKAVFPEATVVYKKGPADIAQNRQSRSCEVDVPRQAFLDKFQFCALSGLIGGEGGITYNFAGGRMVELSVGSHPGEIETLAAFACMPR